ncbi:MAG: SMP-30/gluconolactonase/LRE family protein [Hyphomonadaceae bacterium]
MSNFEILAEGLQFPEGPIAMPDGSVILVEIKRKTLTRVWNGKSEVIAEIGGGPNGAAFGPDGAIYLTNNGGFEFHDISGLTIPGHAASDYTTGRIERVDLATGRVERLYDNFEGQRLSGPNDLVFDKSGGFWFTDLGKNYKRSSDRGGLYYAKTDSSLLKEASMGMSASMASGFRQMKRSSTRPRPETAKLWAFDITGEERSGRTTRWAVPRGGASLCSPIISFFDSLALQANGDVCVATILNGGVTTITPQGVSAAPFPDDHDQYLFRRRRHERRVHHALSHRQAGEGRS